MSLIRQLGEQAGAVTGAVGRLGAAVVEPDQALDRQPQASGTRNARRGRR